MTPIVKDPENAVAPSGPGVSATPLANAPGRPQPVALEVPVTVNGARRVEGSDKREPFSERSHTVLVFGHGAVLRISATLAPGQLIFLTNEKTNKEVVCQVIKSKTDGNAVGYVELRFTEPAPGFWGQRFPADTVLPHSAPRPVAPAPVAAPSKVAPTAMPPAAAKPIEPPAAISLQPDVTPPPAPSDFSKELAKATVPLVSSVPPKAEPKAIAPLPVAAGPELIALATLTAEAQPAIQAESLVATEPELSATSPVVAAPELNPAIPTMPASTALSADHSTEKLKVQAARLQEQLSSLLFTDAPKPAAATPAIPASESVLSPDTAEKILDLTNFAPADAASQPVKSFPLSPKPAASSLAVEEIKIPSWLAPLARETETQTSEASSQAEAKFFAEAEAAVAESSGEAADSESQEFLPHPEAVVFGGQLLGESSQPTDASGSGSTMGMFIGIAAALLLVASGAWYLRQPGNVISGLLGGSPSASQPAINSPAAREIFAARPETSTAKPVAKPVIADASSSPAPAPVNPPTPAASAPLKSSSVASVSRNSSANSIPSPRIVPPVEEPKSPSLGNVRLAKPVIKRGHVTAAPSASEPAIDVNQSTNSAATLSSLGNPRGSGPAAPVPVGGDVKSAKLIKSVAPVYPAMAKTQHVSGNVQIDALIDADGNVSAMNVLSGPALLRQAALQSLKQWKYEPAQLDGKPTPMHLTVTLQFRAQ